MFAYTTLQYIGTYFHKTIKEFNISDQVDSFNVFVELFTLSCLSDIVSR